MPATDLARDLGWVELQPGAADLLEPGLLVRQRECFPALVGVGRPQRLRALLESGVTARVVSVDAARLPRAGSGQPIDEELVAALEHAGLESAVVACAVLAVDGDPPIPVYTGATALVAGHFVTPLRVPLPTLDAATCPVCGEPNACPMAGSASYAGGCWCESVVTTPRLLAMMPRELDRKACICRPCHERFATAPALDPAATAPHRLPLL